MPEFVMKADPDRDLYVLWSTVVDDAVVICTSRDEMLECLRERVVHVKDELTPSNTPEAELNRCDENGTSYKYKVGNHHPGSWEDARIRVRGEHEILRSDLGNYLDLILSRSSHLRLFPDAYRSVLIPIPRD